MRGLLIKLQAELTGVIDNMRDDDVVLTPDPDLLPVGAKFPCIGIKDGKIDISELMGNALEKNLPVEIYYYDRLVAGDQCILDFLENCENISDKLKGNVLAGYVKSASPVSETAIRTMYTKQGPIMRKGLFHQYETEE